MFQAAHNKPDESSMRIQENHDQSTRIYELSDRVLFLKSHTIRDIAYMRKLSPKLSFASQDFSIKKENCNISMLQPKSGEGGKKKGGR